MTKSKSVTVHKPTDRVPAEPYIKLLEHVGGLLMQANKANLKITREIGRDVAKLMENRAAIYGNRSIDKLAQDLTETGWPIKANTLYAAKMVATQLTAEQYKLAQTSGISMHSLAPLCASRVSDELRTEILNEAIKRRLTRDDIKGMIDKVLPPGADNGSDDKNQLTAGDNTAQRDALKVLKGVANMLGQMASADRRPAIADAVKTICRGTDEEAMQKAKDLHEQIAVASITLSGFWSKELEAAEESLQDISEVIGG